MGNYLDPRWGINLALRWGISLTLNRKKWGISLALNKLQRHSFPGTNINKVLAFKKRIEAEIAEYRSGLTLWYNLPLKRVQNGATSSLCAN